MIVGAVELKLSSESLLALAEHTKAVERLAAAIEARGCGNPIVSEAPKAPAPFQSAQWHSAERDALIVRMRSDGKSWREIFWAVCELPGPPPVSVDALKNYGRTRLHAVRPPESFSAFDLARLDAMAIGRTKRGSAQQTPAVVPAPQPQVPAAMMERISAFRALPGAGERREADFEQVRQWAGERGLRFETWDDLPRINAKADQLGIAGFKRKFPQRGAA